MTLLEKRRQRVERLARLCLADRNPQKYMQARFILAEIDRRINVATNYRTLFINQIRN